MISKNINNSHLFLQHLRSLTFYFISESVEKSERVSIIQQILDMSPNLAQLKLHWRDFRHCSQTYSNLKQLHLQLHRLRVEPKQYINVRRLAELAPNLRSLETSGANIMYNENLVPFVLKIIRRFHRLVYLTLNKHSEYRSKEEKKIMFREKLLEAGHNHLFNSNNIRICLDLRDDLYIWL